MNKVLIIIDMQNDFLTGALANPTANALVEPIADFIKNNTFNNIIFTQDTHREGEYAETQEGRKLPIPHCIYPYEGWRIAQPLEEAALQTMTKGLICIIKPTFGYKDWGDMRELEHADEIHVCGTCTDICVITNVALLKTFFPETPIYLHANLCAGLTPHKHECAIETMRSMQVEIVE